jgi:hypothetical protein
MYGNKILLQSGRFQVTTYSINDDCIGKHVNVIHNSLLLNFCVQIVAHRLHFLDKMLVVCNNFITFAPIKQKSYGFIIQKK